MHTGIEASEEDEETYSYIQTCLQTSLFLHAAYNIFRNEDKRNYIESSISSEIVLPFIDSDTDAVYYMLKHGGDDCKEENKIVLAIYKKHGSKIRNLIKDKYNQIIKETKI